MAVTIKLNKKETQQAKRKKIAKASVNSKNIDWNKYFGKIKFPVNAISYQQKLRDEWVK